jgi:tRNA dimethylallyltransferase
MAEDPEQLRRVLERAWWIAGPTASGKSQLGMLLAQALDAEIISVDSMQVYRGLDIGTAKPSHADQQQVRHHLIDVADLHEPFDAAAFRRLALEAALEIDRRGKPILFCGGTGFYFQALLQGVGEGPSGDPMLREHLRQWDDEQLKEKLRDLDPEAYQRIDLQNPRKVIRALEVVVLTGRPFADSQADWSQPLPLGRGRCWIIDRPVEQLNERIVQRVDEMLRDGWIEETRQLMERGLESAPTASKAIGYPQVVEYLSGRMGFDAMKRWIAIRTRQLAKRQRTWFRHQLSGSVLPQNPSLKALVDHMLAQGNPS